MMDKNSKIKRLKEIFQACDNEIIGRIRLQKLAYLAEKINYGLGVKFHYHHYGPFSEGLVSFIDDVVIDETVSEEIKRKKNNLGEYFVYKINDNNSNAMDNNSATFFKAAKEIDPLYLELLATALFLQEEDKETDVWQKLRELKPEKAQDKYLQKSYEAYCKLQELSKNLEDITALPDLPELVSN